MRRGACSSRWRGRLVDNVVPDDTIGAYLRGFLAAGSWPCRRPWQMIYTIGIYHLRPAMANTRTAKLFKHGRSQAVRLPKEFRMPGTEVRVRRLGYGVLLEPIDTPFDVNAWF